MWLFSHFMKKPAQAALSVRMSATEDSNTHKEETLTTYCQPVSYLLSTYETYDVLVEPRVHIMNYKQPGNFFVTPYSETICEKAPRSRRVYIELRLKSVFIGGLHPSIILSKETYLVSSKRATLQNLARDATLLLKLQQVSSMSSATTQPESHSGQKPLKNNIQRRQPTAMMPIANKHSSESFSPSKETLSKALGLSKR